MTTPHDATQYSNPAWKSPAETVAQEAAANAAAATEYDRSAKSTVDHYKTLTGLPPRIPVIDGIAPDDAPQGTGPITVTFTGKGFISESVVRLNGETGLSTTVNSTTELTAEVPDNEAGPYELTVDNGEGNISAPVTFTYVTPG